MFFIGNLHFCDLLNYIPECFRLFDIFRDVEKPCFSTRRGTAEIRADINPEYAEITLIDSGTPYDPLAKEDPDVDLAPDDRPVGGLGIFMVKQFADECFYEYIEDKNVLTIKVRC